MDESQRLAQVFVELADTLVDEFDVVDFLQTLTERCVEMLRADASGLMLTDQRGGLRLMAATLERARVLELFELQIQEGPCLEASPGPGHHQRRTRRGGGHPAMAGVHPGRAQAGFGAAHALPMRLRAG